jgi:hypothetical protein
MQLRYTFLALSLHFIDSSRDSLERCHNYIILAFHILVASYILTDRHSLVDVPKLLARGTRSKYVIDEQIQSTGSIGPKV